MQPSISKFEFINHPPNLRPKRILEPFHHMRLSVHGIVVFIPLKDFISAANIMVSITSRDLIAPHPADSLSDHVILDSFHDSDLLSSVSLLRVFH